MGSFDVITYYLLKKFKPRLSRLIIDTDKDWMGHVIKNLGTPVDPYDALRLIELNAHKSAIPLDHPDGSVTTEKIADGAITDAKVSSISRSKIADFWNTPFWDNIPDKPSTFPPEPHTHLRNEISDFWNTPFWDNIPDKPYLFEVISDLTVDSDCDYIEWSGLDILTDGVYVIFGAWKNPTSSVMVILLFINGNETSTNYKAQILKGSGTNIYVARRDYPEVAVTHPNQSTSFILFVLLAPDGYLRAIAPTNMSSPTTPEVEVRCITSTFTVSNITSIRMQTKQAGGIGAGSRFILCRVKSS